MKILIVIPRFDLTDKSEFDYTFPLGLAYISAVLKKAKYHVDCINLNHFNGKTNEIISKFLNSREYNFVCTGGNALIYAEIEKILIASSSHVSKPLTILGGPIITTEPKLIFNSLNPDFGVIGEGEETILELLDFYTQKKDLKNVKGIIYRDKTHNLIQTPARSPIENLDSIPFPDFDGFGFEKQLSHLHSNWVYHANFFDYPRIYPLLASRSCPYKCTFCYHDSKYRKRSLKNVIQELDLNIKKYRINTIIIYDECFALDKKRLSDFCDYIKKISKEVSWPIKFTCQFRVEPAVPEILKKLKDAGCEAISYGFESYSPIVLNSMRKGISPQQIDNAIQETMKAKISVQGNFIFGDPAETMETANETLEYYKNKCKGQIGLGFIQPYPGSDIYNYCIKKGLIKDKLSFIKNEIIAGRGIWLNMTNAMSFKEIMDLRKKVLEYTGKYSKFLIPKLKKTSNNTYEVRTSCPYCHKPVYYKNCLIKNRLSFGFLLICRDCHMKFFVVSLTHKIGYKYYSFFRKIRDLEKKISSFIKKKNI